MPESSTRDTAGNAFFVTEVLREGPDVIPISVADAVLARVARLSRAARDVIEVAAVIGVKVQPQVVAEISGADPSLIDECVTAG